jgi:8-oxo-dGTP diphosphatase
VPLVIRAAGGLVVRKTAKGKIKVLMAHRPAYDDWALPKGKRERDESPEATAIREVLEETGYHCRIVAPVGTTRHRVDTETKEVTWFLMRPLPDSPGFAANSEIDRIRWVTPKQARNFADYESDRELIGGADLKRLTRTGRLRLFRHGQAGDRDRWAGEDLDRPLTEKGRGQAAAIAKSLDRAEIDRIVSSPYRRCLESVEPLAALIGADIEVDDRLAETRSLEPALDLVGSLVGYNAVLCSHGDIIPTVLKRLRKQGLSLGSGLYCSKGSIWEVDVDGGKYTVARYLPPPKV